MSNHHPTRRLTAPDGSRVRIDVMLAPLIKTLWKLGYDTITCCQDVGESLDGYAGPDRDNYWHSGLMRKAAHWKGYASLEMPLEDAFGLLADIRETPQFADRMHWAAPGGWEMSCPVIAGEPDEEPELIPWVQFRFPNDQIDELVKVLTYERAPS